MSPLCSLCNQHPEDILHLSCNCAKAQDLWNSFANALGENLDLPQLNPTIVFLGISNIQGNDNVLLNHILLLFKKFIYDKKNHPARIHFLSFMNYVKKLKKLNKKLHTEKVSLNFISKMESNTTYILIFCFTVHSLYPRAHWVRPGGWEFRCCVNKNVNMQLCFCK